MNNHDHGPADEDSRNDEYAELWQQIVNGRWNPGDIFRSSTGVAWMFRVTPYTSDFPEMTEQHLLRKPEPGSRHTVGTRWLSAEWDTAIRGPR